MPLLSVVAQLALARGLRQAAIMQLAPELQATLGWTARALAPARHDWWIISSAAIALHGVEPGPIGDVDVLFDPRDAAAVLGPLGIDPRPGTGTELFRSAIFARWTATPMPVELFAGFELCEAGIWQAIRPETREQVRCGNALVYVPAREELAAMLRRFGRPKDLDRAARLSPSGLFPSRSGSA
jgi:hypothetical protein